MFPLCSPYTAKIVAKVWTKNLPVNIPFPRLIPFSIILSLKLSFSLPFPSNKNNRLFVRDSAHLAKLCACSRIGFGRMAYLQSKGIQIVISTFANTVLREYV